MQPPNMFDHEDLAAHRTLWATTHFGNVTVTIYLNDWARLKDYDGNTFWQNGTMAVDLSARLASQPSRLGSVLIHELTHVVEYANDPTFLDPTPIEDCTLLAQTMEACLGAMLLNMKLAPGAKWPFVPKRLHSKKKAG
jgi:hypothetical protein